MDHLYIDVFPIGKGRFIAMLVQTHFDPSRFNVAGYSLYVNVGISSYTYIYIVIGMRYAVCCMFFKSVKVTTSKDHIRLDKAASQCMIPIRRAHPYFGTNK